MPEELLREYGEPTDLLSWHLIKYHEILDAAVAKLPRLRTIETQLHSENFDIYFRTRVKATIKDGTLWVNWNEVKQPLKHDWADQTGELVFSDEEDEEARVEYSDYADAPYSPASSLSEVS
jgi:hypothetical protein